MITSLQPGILQSKKVLGSGVLQTSACKRLGERGFTMSQSRRGPERCVKR